MITKENNNLVLRIPLEQDSYDACDTLIGKVPNLIGNIIERKNGLSEYTINQLIDLGYKDSQQIGYPIICLNDREELEEACKELGIGIEETTICAYCDEPMYGSFTMGDKGYQCWECQREEERIDKKIDYEINN